MSYKVVFATYTVRECFVVPKNIDLENKEQVESYWVKYNTLYIKLTNGKDIEIENRGWVEDYDYKYPDETRIEEGCDYGYDDEDELFDDIDIGIFEKEEIKKIEEEEEEDEEPIRLNKYIYNNKKYLLDKKTNDIYDFDAGNEGELLLLGKLVNNNIEFTTDLIDIIKSI